mmetsp:Transcript_108497/g.188378  ORF Transcript_108497/g.188378 Transcript_108497/m.188378 type:complete len:229 (+) Transcript_108497:140-826(+)
MASATASAPQLPAVSSVYPLRRTASLTSVDRSTAQRCWQSTLRERLGTPGHPPGRDELPSLYNRPSQISPNRPPSGISQSPSAPPSTVGPSASIVAWFAQFRCENCGTIPLALEARFCSSCGHSLSIVIPPEIAYGKSEENRSALNREAPRDGGGPRREDGRRADGRRPRSSSRNAGPREEQLIRAGAKLAAGRPPRPPGPADGKHLPWAARESQVAVWLGNVKPRLP